MSRRNIGRVEVGASMHENMVRRCKPRRIRARESLDTRLKSIRVPDSGDFIRGAERESEGVSGSRR